MLNNMKMLESNTYVHGLMLLAIILASSSFPIGASITNELPPEIMMFLRFLIAAFMFFPFVIAKNGLVLPSSTSLRIYILLSIPLVAFFWCMFESLRYTSVLNTGALYTLVPVITAVYAFILNRELTDKLRIFGLLIGTIGALWIVFRGNYESFIGLDLNYGDVIFLLGCLFLGLYNPLLKRLYSGESMIVMTFWILLSGATLLFLISITNNNRIDWLDIKSDVYLSIIYLSFFSTLATFLIINYSTIRIGATKVSAYGFLTPLFVIAMSIFVGMDSFDIVILPGILLIMGAMMFIQREDKYITSEIESDT